MSKEPEIEKKYLTPEEYIEAERQMFLGGYPDFKVNWNAFPEPEPEAWFSLSDIEWINIVNSPKILELTNGRHNSEEAVNLAVKMTEEICKKKNSNSIPIPKREPLSDEKIYIGLQVDNTNHLDATSFTAGVRFAEKAHGIGEL